jgi:hypothetical protein
MAGLIYGTPAGSKAETNLNFRDQCISDRFGRSSPCREIQRDEAGDRAVSESYGCRAGVPDDRVTFARRQVAGASPTSFLKARLNAASDS